MAFFGVLGSHTPRNYGEADNQNRHWVPIESEHEFQVAANSSCGRTRRFRWFLFRCALSTFEERETYGLKKPSPAQPSLSRSLSFSLSDNLSDRPQFSSDTFTQMYCIQKDNCVFMYRDEPLTALWKTSTERKVPN